MLNIGQILEDPLVKNYFISKIILYIYPKTLKIVFDIDF